MHALFCAGMDVRGIGHGAGAQNRARKILRDDLQPGFKGINQSAILHTL